MTTHPYTRLQIFLAPPGVGDDETTNPPHEVGDVAYVVGGSIYDCRDASAGAAVWEERGAHTHTSVPGNFAFPGDITPTTLSGNVNDYNPTGLSTAAVLRLSSDTTPRTITGLQGGADGRILFLINVGATYNVVLADESASSSAANRFSFGGTDFKLAPKRGLLIIYDSTANLWRPMVLHDHFQLANIGNYTHATIDNHLDSTSNPHSVTAGQAGAIPTDGWQAVSATWTRTGNHTFTVSGDVTATYRKGTKVRYKDGGSYEYGVIGSSSHAAGTTTVNLIPNSDYAMAAATITDKYVSYIESPEGFPDWFNLSVSWTSASNPQPSIGNGALSGKWEAQAKGIAFQIYLVAGSTTTFGTGQWYFALPADAVATGTGQEIGIVYALDSGTMNYFGFWYLSSGSNLISILRDNTTTPFNPTTPFTWTTNDILSIKGFYQY